MHSRQVAKTCKISDKIAVDCNYVEFPGSRPSPSPLVPGQVKASHLDPVTRPPSRMGPGMGMGGSPIRANRDVNSQRPIIMSKGQTG
jgi:hypothetical protein